MQSYDPKSNRQIVPGGTPYDPAAWPISLKDFMEDPRWVLNGLTAIGAKKPMGFLDDANFRGFGLEPEVVLKTLRQRGVEIVPVSRSGSRPEYIGTADLWHTDPEDLREEDFVDVRVNWTTYYGFDQKALQAVLDRNTRILSDADWPLSARDFVLRVANENVPIESPVFRVIAEAFNDPESIRVYDLHRNEEEGRLKRR